MTPWMVVTVVSKSSTSWLIETFMTAWSRTMRNWAMARAARVIQDLIGWVQPGPEASGIGQATDMARTIATRRGLRARVRAILGPGGRSTSGSPPHGGAR